MEAARARRRPASPAELARLLIRDYRVTPTIQLLSDALKRAVEEPNRRLIITCAPRTGKTKLTSIALPVWALMRDPDTEIILKSYGDSLGGESSAEARRLIAEHSELLGFELAPDKQAAGRWRVAGHRGGMLAGGIFAGTVGFGANLLILDDPIKSRIEADSETFRRRLWNEFHASLMTRLMPGGSVVIILTRWSEHDLAGELISSSPDVWDVVNIPAISTVGVPDALDRDRPGVAFTSANGFTVDDFASIRRQLGEREFAAQYLGSPSTPEGGLIKAAWLENWRLPAAPSGAIKTVVGVDPADSGEGDETGILAASLAADGTVALIADVSGHYTSDQWARRAVELAIDVGASEVCVEAFAARATYTRLVAEALPKYRLNRPMWVSGWPPKGTDRGKGDAVTRATGLLAALETGRCRVAGYLPEFERQATAWEAGAHQPDRVAAAVVAYDVLAHSIGQQMRIVPMADIARRVREGELPPPARMRRRIGGR
jgi:hypothetical protein